MTVYIKTYGIACVSEINGRFEIVTEVPCVTTDREQADRLVKLFNEHKLSPEHLEDVVEDLISIM